MNGFTNNKLDGVVRGVKGIKFKRAEDVDDGVVPIKHIVKTDVGIDGIVKGTFAVVEEMSELTVIVSVGVIKKELEVMGVPFNNRYNF